MNPGFTEAILPRLKPGDLLIYSRAGLLPWFIKVKTWSIYSHVETYLGYGTVHAARKGIGVGTFTISYDGLVLVRRPEQPFDYHAAKAYAREVWGQRYDLVGALRFFTVGVQSTEKQFCSEDATRLARRAGVEPFADRLDADLVSPRDLAFSPTYYDLAVFNGVEHDTPIERELV